MTKERELEPEESAILGYLDSHSSATTKEITENTDGLPKNRAIVENYLTKLFVKDHVQMSIEGRARVWSKNHISVNLQKKPKAFAVLAQDNEYGRRKIWFDLHPSPRGDGDYVYIQESRFVNGQGWNNKGGIVVSLDMMTEFVANLLKIALKSEEFNSAYPDVSKQLENFLKEVSLHAGVKE